MNEWAKLGEKYPEARRRLEGKAEQALAELQRTRKPALFHDLISINEYLGRDAASIDQFLKFHTSDRPLAESSTNAPMSFEGTVAWATVGASSVVAAVLLLRMRGARIGAMLDPGPHPHRQGKPCA